MKDAHEAQQPSQAQESGWTQQSKHKTVEKSVMYLQFLIPLTSLVAAGEFVKRKCTYQRFAKTASSVTLCRSIKSLKEG